MALYVYKQLQAKGQEDGEELGKDQQQAVQQGEKPDQEQHWSSESHTWHISQNLITMAQVLQVSWHMPNIQCLKSPILLLNSVYHCHP